MDTFQEEFLLLGVESNKFLVGYGPFRESCEPDPELPSFFVQDFYFSDPTPWKIPQTTRLLDAVELEAFKTSQVEVDFVPPNFKNYAQLFEEMESAIVQKRIAKAVPVIFEVGEITSGDPLSILSRLPRVSNSLHRYAVHLNKSLIVGASPELLLHKGQESQLVFSEAIAGTTLTSNSDRLLHDPHLLQEHRLVVEDISAQLSPFGRTHVSSNSFQPYPGLMHLRAQIALEIDEIVGPTELISALHPTGALGIIPRQPLTSTLMKKLDPQGCRGMYGAPFGVVLPNGYWNFVVMIRNVMFNQGQARIGSGGGLLTGSTLAQEWTELEAKRLNVKKLLLPRICNE